MSSNSAASECSINKPPLFYLLFLKGCFEGGKWFLGELLLRNREEKFLEIRTGREKLKLLPNVRKLLNYYSKDQLFS
jgi:hypothetical protein